jgi:hypothetical protein
MKKINNEYLQKQIEKIIAGSVTEDLYFDFKQEWYSDDKKGELMMDILSFSNSTYGPYSYIIIGVNDAGEVVGVSDKVNVKERNDFVTNVVKSAHFSGDVRPDFYVTSIVIQEKRIDVIVIESNSENAPFFLSEKYPSNGKTADSAGIGIYVRDHAENTPRDRNADRHLIEELWSRHFQKDKQLDPIDQFAVLLRDVNMWEDPHDRQGFNSVVYYKKNPAFAIFFDRNSNLDDPKRDQTIIQLIQTDDNPSFEYLKLLLWDRVIYFTEMSVLDGGRAVVPTPKEDFIDIDYGRTIYPFHYFTKDSIDYSILFYCLHSDYDSESREAVRRVFEVVDLYEDESEVAVVKDYVLQHYVEYEKNVKKKLADSHFFGNWHHYGTEQETKALRRDIASSVALMEMHKKWRTEMGFPSVVPDL